MKGNAPRGLPQMIMSLGANGSEPRLRSFCGRLHTSSSTTGVTGVFEQAPVQPHRPIPTTAPSVVATAGGASYSVLQHVHLTGVRRHAEE